MQGIVKKVFRNTVADCTSLALHQPSASHPSEQGEKLALILPEGQEPSQNNCFIIRLIQSFIF